MIDKQIQLIHILDGERLYVQPHASDGTPMEPFPLPRLSRAVADVCLNLLQQFRSRTGRCMAGLLAVEPTTGSWEVTVPPQRCSHDSACWQMVLPSSASGRGYVVGSFQSRVLHAGEDPKDAVPPVDGLHMVMLLSPVNGAGIDRPAPPIYMFLRAGDMIRPLPASQVLRDEVESCLADAVDRMLLN